MDKETGKSLPQEIADLMPSTRFWMQQKGYIKNIVEDGQVVQRITEEGYRFLDGFKNFRETHKI